MFLIYLEAVEGVSPHDLSSAKKYKKTKLFNSNHSMAPMLLKNSWWSWKLDTDAINIKTILHT